MSTWVHTQTWEKPPDQTWSFSTDRGKSWGSISSPDWHQSCRGRLCHQRWSLTWRRSKSPTKQLQINCRDAANWRSDDTSTDIQRNVGNWVRARGPGWSRAAAPPHWKEPGVDVLSRQCEHHRVHYICWLEKHLEDDVTPLHPEHMLRMQQATSLKRAANKQDNRRS